jgi:hypothetical protein
MEEEGGRPVRTIDLILEVVQRLIREIETTTQGT